MERKARPRVWLYVATEKAASEEATLALARLGAVWVPGNLVPRELEVAPGDVVILLWKSHAGDTRGHVLGGSEVATPRTAWAGTTWLETVPAADPLFGASARLGYRGPPNYRTMLRLSNWTEEPGEVHGMAAGLLPHLLPGGWVTGLSPGSLLTEAQPGRIEALATTVREDPLSVITADAGVLGGKPTIRGLRIAVEHVLGWLAAGASVAEILESYPELQEADVFACLRYAERLIANERIEPAVSGR